MKWLIFLLMVILLGVHSSEDLTRVRLALRHNSLDQLLSLFNEISDPHSPQYARYLSLEQTRQLSGTSKEDVSMVGSWLKSFGPFEIVVLPSGDVVTTSLPNNLALQIFRDIREGTNVVVPEPIHDIIDVVLVDGMRFGEEIKSQPRRQNKFSKFKSFLGDANPNFQKQFYQIDVSLKGNNSKNSQMVWGPGTYGVSTTDLNTFYSLYNINTTSSDIIKLGFPGKPGGDNWGEGTLDATYITSFAPGVKTFVINSNDSQSTEEGKGFGYAFLDELLQLSQQPTSSLPLVISLSLGSLSFDSCSMMCNILVKSSNFTLQQCNDFMELQRQVCMYDTEDQVQRMNTEMSKLGLRGVSILAATGDGGSHFSFGPFENTEIGKALNLISCKYNFPTFPASSPYVTAVGGIDFGLNPQHPVAWYGSGGGFSWQFDMLSYQKDVVNTYFSLARGSPSFPSPGSFDPTKRAYPDVAAVSSNTPLYVDGHLVEAGGTSVSTPTFAGIISLINDYRLNHQLPPLGFLNPRLYEIATSHPGEAFYDITSGNTATTCAEGFPAVQGWDPTSGLGSPLFPGLLKYLGQ